VTRKDPEATPSAGGAAAAPLEEGDDEPAELDPLAVLLAEPLAVAEAVELPRDEALVTVPEEDIPSLRELDLIEAVPVADADKVTPAPPVGMRLSVVLAGRTSELEGEGSLTKSATILISVH
jgi:hypothetical protein